VFARIATFAALLAACGTSDVSRIFGARCDVISECDERCLTGDQFPGGFCSLSCDVESDCPSAAECVDSEGGVCLFGCRDQADCDFLGLGWSCQALPGAEGGEVMACAGQ
jgi:hypothetical protein